MDMVIKTLENVFPKNDDIELKGKVIRKASIARKILEFGGNKVRIIDLKVDRDDPDRKRSVFVFEDTPDFQEVMTYVLENNKKTYSNAIEEENKVLKNDLEELKKKFDELSNIAEKWNSSVKE